MIHQKVKSLEGLAMRAYSGISFDPEKRGARILTDYGEELTEDVELLQKHETNIEWYENKYVSLLSSWLSAQGRCVSTMITGGSNFPVRRAEKANQSEHDRYVEFREWRERVIHKATTPPSNAIVKGSEGAMQKMIEKLSKLERLHDVMKGTNSILRKKGLTNEDKVKQIIESYPEIKEETAKELLSPGFGTKYGFASFSLTNNNAKINLLKKDIAAEERRETERENGNKEYTINGINVCENVEQNRIQILFEGKPEFEMRTKLKKNGFRWSPRNTAWQRQLTANAVYATKNVLS
jgi:hypothetical protein